MQRAGGKVGCIAAAFIGVHQSHDGERECVVVPVHPAQSAAQIDAIQRRAPARAVGERGVARRHEVRQQVDAARVGRHPDLTKPWCADEPRLSVDPADVEAARGARDLLAEEAVQKRPLQELVHGTRRVDVVERLKHLRVLYVELSVDEFLAHELAERERKFRVARVCQPPRENGDEAYVSDEPHLPRPRSTVAQRTVTAFHPFRHKVLEPQIDVWQM